MPNPFIKQIQVGGVTHDLNVLAIQDESGNPKYWSDITSLVEAGFTVEVPWTKADYESATAPTAAKRATVPAVTIYYNNGQSSTTGTLSADDSQSGSEGVKHHIYLIYHKHEEDADNFDEYVSAGSGASSKWEKIGNTDIDLSNYVTKGTYTSGAPSTNVTGSAGGETIDTGETDLGTATGTIRLVDHTISGHTHGVSESTYSVNYNAIKEVTLSASSTTTDGPKYLESASISGTTIFNTDAIKSVSVTTSDKTSDGDAVVTDVTGSAPSLGGTKTFITGYPDFSGGSGAMTATVRYMKITPTDATAGDKGTVELSDGAVTGTFNTNAIKAITGTKNYGFSSSVSSVMYAPTVTNEVLQWSTSTASTQDAHTGTAADTADVSYTKQTLTGDVTFVKNAIKSVSLSASTVTTDGPKYVESASHSHTAASLGTPNQGTVSISGGSYTPTYKYLRVTSTPATTATVGVTTTTKYMGHTTTSADTTVVLTGVTIQSGGSTTLTHTTNTTAPTLPVSVALGKHKHSVTTSNHTHSLSNHTHSTTLE